MKVKFTLLLAFVMCLGPMVSRADDATPVWNMVVDASTSIPMSEIAYLVAADNQTSFSIVKNDNSVVENVSKVTFAKKQAGVGDLASQNVGVVLLSSVVSNTLNLTCASDMRAEIYDAAGALRMASDIVAGAASIDVSALQPGVYVLRVGNTSVKFIKK